MDSHSSNDDEESRITVFSSTNSGNDSSRQMFDTIAFNVPKKEPTITPSLLTPPPIDPYIPTPTTAMSKTSSMVSMLADDLQFGDQAVVAVPSNMSDPSGFMKYNASHSFGDQLKPMVPSAYVAISVDEDGEDLPQMREPLPTSMSEPMLDSNEVIKKLEHLNLNTNVDYQDTVEIEDTSLRNQKEGAIESNLFQDLNSAMSMLPEVSHLVTHFPTLGMPQSTSPSMDTFSKPLYTMNSISYDAWIPSEETKKILLTITSEVSSGTHVPNQEHMTMPGILLEDDLIDKVGANVGKLFGPEEAGKRKTFTADSVTQDDHGLRELIKLGCYRAAINLTKRLLILYGQGPGKVGHFSKHTPHSLQLWFTRISLLVRIREFSTAETELEAFKGFGNPDMYYDYYPDVSGSSRKGSMVPFHFRLLAAEIPQYMRKFNETINKLYDIFFRVQTILENLNKGKNEDGSSDIILDAEHQRDAIGIWKKREIRVLYSLTNSSLFAKDYYNAFNFLTQLCTKDSEHLAQLKSGLGRLFLQHGDISRAEVYFHEAAELRSPDSDSEQIDSLVDSALLSISQNLYHEAIELLKQALMLQPENFMITNNLAVCHLYLGNVKESLALMEMTVKQNMPQSLQENVILNLCSVYELENSDGSKKLGLLKLISEYKGDGINLASLKLPDLI